ncbi:MAG: glycosyltransferase family 4 protein [Balneolales bacterium]
MSKILFLIPRLQNIGGVANYYSVLKIKMDANQKFIFLPRGNKKNSSTLVRLLLDYIRFIKAIKRNNVNLIVINTSLGVGGFFRDFLYFWITSKKIKKVIFFRGWNLDFEKKIENSSFYNKIFLNTFLKANHIIVLSSAFKKKLISWGYKGKISLETTIVDESLIENQSIESLHSMRKKLGKKNILYLGNVKKEKGVCEVVDAVRTLTTLNKKNELTAIIAGSGILLETLKSKAEKEKLPIFFPGYVKEDSKIETYANSHLYVFPSVHGEGMPNSVLEAMAFGLPVITTRVGGIPDFFEEGKMGLFLENREPHHIAEKIQYLLDRPELRREMSEYNYNYAKEHFYASKVAKRLEKILEMVIKKDD